jgi:hypothetical protein
MLTDKDNKHAIFLPDEEPLLLGRGMSLEAMLVQLQSYSQMILCAVNGSTIQYYDSLEQLPEGLALETKTNSEFYFRDQKKGDLYCFFREDIAYQLGLKSPEPREPISGELPDSSPLIKAMQRGRITIQEPIDPEQVAQGIVLAKNSRGAVLASGTENLGICRKPWDMQFTVMRGENVELLVTQHDI